MKRLILTQTQIKTLYEISLRFQDIPRFELVETSENGIGPTIHVKFDLFGKKVEIDNTDVSNW